MSFLAPLKKVIEFCGKCKRPMAGNYPVCMNRSCVYFNKDSSERQEMQITMETRNPHLEPIMDLSEYESEGGNYITFPISHESSKSAGVPRCSIEVIWKKGKMDWLLVSFPNVPSFESAIFQVELPNSTSFLISGEALNPISGWCSDHKSQYFSFCVYGKTLRIHKLETCLIEVK